VAEGHRIIYGGAKNGLMGVMADEALKCGGSVVGVIPALLVDKELLLKDLSEIHIVASMHERKKKMSELAEVFLALPGGAGTLEVDRARHSHQAMRRARHRRIFRTIADDGRQDGRRSFLHERHRASLIFSLFIADVLDGLQRFHAPLAKY
jgi:hypothetical protein